MERGRITKLIRNKKYGSITTDDGREAHFHQQCLSNVTFENLYEGLEIECYVKPMLNGNLAIEIRLH